MPTPLLDSAFPRIYRPAKRRARGTRWTINGWPADVVLFPPSSERPAPDAQIDPSGIWVALRVK